MTNHRLFLWIGGALIVLPFLGIPESWKHLIMFMIALALIAIALIIRSSEQTANTHAGEPVCEDTESAPIATTTREQQQTFEAQVFEEVVTYQAPESFTAIKVSESEDDVMQAPFVTDVVPPKPKKPRKKRVVHVEEPITDTSETFNDETR